MKKILKVFMIMTALIVTLSIANTSDTMAKTAKAKQVKYTLNKGVLIVKGKGAMPKSMTFKGNTKIKKVIIKKGVTSVSAHAFENCKKLQSIKIANSVKLLDKKCFAGTAIKSVTIPASVKTINTEALARCTKLNKVIMPGNFKVSGKPDADENQNIFEGTHLSQVKFNSNLKLKNIKYINTKKIVVWNNDAKYKSIDGVIYSKDGKNLVRVPMNIEKLNIAEGCTTFCLNAIYYGYYDNEEGKTALCQRLREIIIPQSVTKIEDNMYKADVFAYDNIPIEKVTVNSKNIDSDSILTFTKYLKAGTGTNMSVSAIAEIFPDKIKNVNGFYILDGNVLIGYGGTDQNIEIPEGISVITNNVLYEQFKDNVPETYNNGINRTINLPDSVRKIEAEAFKDAQITEINLAEGIKEIGDEAFATSIIEKAKTDKIVIPESVEVFGKNIFSGRGIKEAVLPNNMEEIPEGMFNLCYNMETVNIPKQLKTIKKYAFAYTKVDVQSILNKETLETIEDGAFEMVNWQNIIIPENIKTIGEGALCNESVGNRLVTVKGDTAGYSPLAFTYYGNLSGSLQYAFEKGIRQSFTTADVGYHTVLKKKTTKAEITWIKVKDVDGYSIVVASDKNFKKNVKKYAIEKNINRKVCKINKKYNKMYVKIRPYKVINNKKVYGKWTVGLNNVK